MGAGVTVGPDGALYGVATDPAAVPITGGIFRVDPATGERTDAIYGTTFAGAGTCGTAYRRGPVGTPVLVAGGTEPGVGGHASD